MTQTAITPHTQEFFNQFNIPTFLIAPPNYSDFIKNKETHIGQIKDWINTLNTHIDKKLINENNQQAMTKLIPELLTLRTQSFDFLLSKLFVIFNHNSSLFALGGYARNELFPYSDLDLLILYQDKDNLTQLHEFIALLWDIGITPALRIHHIDDKDSVNDITIATSLLENRFLAGNQQHQALPLAWVKQHYTPSEFFQQKFAEYQNRHNKQDNSEYVLEPDIKEGVGGLRDIHFLHWIGKFYFGLPPTATLQALVSKGFLTQDECNELINAKQFLWLIRHCLHTLNGKDNNKLDFGAQKTLAHLLNYPKKDNNPNYTPECLMKEYYQAVMTISTLSEYLGQLFFNEFLNPVKKQKLTDDYFIANSSFGEQLGIYDTTLFNKDPSQILKLFLIMGKHGIKQLTPKTLRALRNCSSLINQAFLDNIHHRTLFIQNLNEPNFLFHRLRLMKRTGVLGAYLPSFAKITGLMQYDLFHRYTVDAHTLLLIRILHRFGQDDEFGVIKTIYTELDNKLPLVVAGLFHDIAKGRGGDHSELGAVDVREFCHSHRLPKDDADLAEWLVRHHLVMSITAQKKDIDDPNVINNFAQFVGDIRHLDTLYLLTVADMNATNSQLWNNWRASLLKKLYLATHQILSTGQKITSPNTIIKERQEKALALITLKLGKTLPNVHAQTHALWQDLPPEYFLKEEPKDIAWHSQALLTHDRQSPLVLVRPHKDKSLHAHQLFIYTANKSNLFAVTVMILDYFGFGVYGANILTDRQDFALDSYVIVDKALANKSILDDTLTATPQSDTTALITCLGTSLQDPESFLQNPLHAKVRASTRLQHFLIATQVFFDNAGNQHHLHIYTKDRPSLLARIGMGFYELGLAVHSAKITTLGERAEDVFLVSEPDGTALSEHRQQAIINTLKTLLDD